MRPTLSLIREKVFLEYCIIAIEFFGIWYQYFGNFDQQKQKKAKFCKIFR